MNNSFASIPTNSANDLCGCVAVVDDDEGTDGNEGNIAFPISTLLVDRAKFNFPVGVVLRPNNDP